MVHQSPLSFDHSFPFLSAFEEEHKLDLNLFRLGVLACYLDPLHLGSFLQDPAVSLTLWQQLAQCMTKGFISDNGRVRIVFSDSAFVILSALPHFTQCLIQCVGMCPLDSCPLG